MRLIRKCRDECHHFELQSDCYCHVLHRYIPIIMLIIALAAFFSVGSRILTMFGVSR